MPRAKSDLAKGRGSPVIAILIFVAIAAAVMAILTLRQFAGAEQHCLRLLAGFAGRVEFRVEDLADRFAKATQLPKGPIQPESGDQAPTEELETLQSQIRRVQSLDWVDCTNDLSIFEDPPAKAEGNPGGKADQEVDKGKEKGVEAERLVNSLRSSGVPASGLAVRAAQNDLYLYLRREPHPDDSKGSKPCLVAQGKIELDEIAKPAILPGIFDSVMIADRDGTVVFRSGEPALRFSSVAQVLAEDDPRDQTLMKTVEIAKRKYRVFVQPMTLELAVSGGPESEAGLPALPVRYQLTAYGVVGNDRLLSNSFMSSPALLVFLLAIFPSCFLFWPLLKLWLITSRQRYTRFDLACLLGCCVVGLSMLTVGAFALQFHLSSKRVAREQIQSLAESVEAELLGELGDVSSLLEEYSCLLTATSGQDEAKEKAKDQLLQRRHVLPYPYFFSIYGMDESGKLSDVLTRSPFSGGTETVSKREYFQCVKHRQGIDSDHFDLPLCLQSILSNTSGRALAAIATPFSSSGVRGSGLESSEQLIGVALTTELRAITRPPLPAGFQIALVDSDGLVQFHSDPTRNLGEDLLRATDGDPELRAVLKQRRQAQVSLNYLGLDQLAYVSPVKKLPWSLVVLRPKADIRQRTAELLLDHLNVVVLHFVALNLVLALIFGLQYVAGMQRPSTWVRHLWPQRAHVALYDAIALLTPLALLAFLYAFEARGIVTRFWLTLVWPAMIAFFVYFLWFVRAKCAAMALIIWLGTGAAIWPWWIWLQAHRSQRTIVLSIVAALFVAGFLALRHLETRVSIRSSVWRVFDRVNLSLSIALVVAFTFGWDASIVEQFAGARESKLWPTLVMLAWASVLLIWAVVLGVWGVEWRRTADPPEVAASVRRGKIRRGFRRIERHLKGGGEFMARKLERTIWANLLGTLAVAAAFLLCLDSDCDALTVVFVTTLVTVIAARFRFRRYFHGRERRIPYIFALSCLLFLLGVVPVTGFLRLAAERQQQWQVQATQLALVASLETYASEVPNETEARDNPRWRLQDSGPGLPPWRSADNLRKRMACLEQGESAVDPIVKSYWRSLYESRLHTEAKADDQPGGAQRTKRFWPTPSDDPVSPTSGLDIRSAIPLPQSDQQIAQLFARRLGVVEDPGATEIGTDMSRFNRPGTRWTQAEGGGVRGELGAAVESCTVPIVSTLPEDHGAQPGTIFQSLWVILGLLLLPATAFGFALILADRVVFVSLAERSSGRAASSDGYRHLIRRSKLHNHPFLVVTTTPEMTFDLLRRTLEQMNFEESEAPRIERAWEVKEDEEGKNQDLLARLANDLQESESADRRLIVVGSDDPRIVASRGQILPLAAQFAGSDESGKGEICEAMDATKKWVRFFSRFEVHHTGRSHGSSVDFARRSLKILGATEGEMIDPLTGPLDLSSRKVRRKILDRLVERANRRRTEEPAGQVMSRLVYQRDFADIFEAIFEESRATQWLQEVGEGLYREFCDESDALCWDAVDLALSTPRRHLISRVGRNARAYYSAIWNGCTTDEQVVLYQLASHGLANPYNFDVVSTLLQKGILVQDPALRMMNESFATFVRSTVHRAEVVQWEEEEGTSAWTVLKWLLPLPLLLIGGFLFVTQGTAWGNFVGLLVALGSVVPILTNTYSYFKKIAAKQDVST